MEQANFGVQLEVAPASDYAQTTITSSPLVVWTAAFDAGYVNWQKKVVYSEDLFGVVAALSLTASEVMGGIVGTAYDLLLSIAGGVSPYAFSVVSGALPTGLTMNPSTGEISGTPTVAGSFSFDVEVTDSSALMLTVSFTIVIAASGGGSSGPSNTVRVM